VESGNSENGVCVEMAGCWLKKIGKKIKGVLENECEWKWWFYKK
jgi:hypothetical protein